MRPDAGFTDGAMLDALDEAGIGYVGRLRENERRRRKARLYMRPSPGRDPKRPTDHAIDSTYRADPWSRERRLVMVVTKDPERLYNEVFFLVTNLPAQRCSAESIRQLYRQRGEAESCMGELKSGYGASLPMTSRLTSTDAEAFARARAMLSLRLLAYEVVHVVRWLLERGTGEGWSLRRVRREQVLKVGVRVRRHARQLFLVPSSSALRSWRFLIEQLERLPVPSG